MTFSVAGLQGGVGVCTRWSTSFMEPVNPRDFHIWKKRITRRRRPCGWQNSDQTVFLGLLLVFILSLILIMKSIYLLYVHFPAK